MEKLENITDESSVVSGIKDSVEYNPQDSNYKGFNPQYVIQEENLNINPLSARSCRCYPGRC